MLTYNLREKLGVSLYEALYEFVRQDIIEGKLTSGEKLPSKRVMAENLGISVMTVENAYAQLIAEGYAESRERSGYYVCDIGELPRRNDPVAFSLSSPKKELTDLSGGGGRDTLFPFSVWVKIMRQVIRRKGKELLEPVDFRGAYELRCSIAEHLHQSRGLTVRPEQIIVGAGNEYLYTLAIQLLGRDRTYGIEDPCYRKISGIYQANEVRLRHIPLDSEGLQVQHLRDCEVVHISPAHHYPTGIVMPVRRRIALLDWAYGASERYIIEDDYDSELRHSGKPLPPLFALDGQQRVLYLSTFSQTITPSLRIGYLCLPINLMEELIRRLGFYACTVPTFEQYTLAEFISSGAYEKHVNRLRKHLRDKRRLVMEQIEKSSLGGRCRIAEENAGTHFLILVDTKLSDAELKEQAKEHGIAVQFLSEFEKEKRSKGSLILNYGCLDANQLPWVLEVLSELIENERLLF